MTLPEQLRAIADRLEAAEAEKAAALDELWQIRTVESGADYAVSIPEPDSAAVPEAAERVPEEGPGRALSAAPSSSAPIEQAGAVRVKRTPAHQAGDAGSTPAPRSTSSAASVHCPDCGEQFKAPGLGVHRRHRHGYKAGALDASRGPINCPDCGESIAQKKNLARHRKTAHGWTPWEPTPVVPTNGAPVMRKGAEWFVCARCDLKFPTREARDRHQVTHPPIPEAPPLRSMARGAE